MALVSDGRFGGSLPRWHPGRRPLTVGLATVGCLAAFVVGSVAPAGAEVGHFRDPDDRVGLDVRMVHVRYGDNLRIRVEHDGRLAAGQVYRFWVDTVAKDPGPEFYYGFRPNSDSIKLRRVDDFGVAGPKVACDGDRAWANFLKPRSDVKALLPAACLGDASPVRVSVRFVNLDGSGDWAPEARAFYDWVEQY